MISRPQQKLLLLSSLGGILDLYDFIIYALFAKYIAANFFPVDSDISSLVVTFATFSLGYLMRPVGGVLFSHFGDRFGRKKTFTLSILIMALATFCIGIVPPYEHIGIAAPIAIVFLRMMQGLSLGGEVPGAIVYVSESIPERKGLSCGIIFFFLNIGIMLGTLASAITNTFFSETHMLTWGWRLPFFIGGLFGFVSYQLRSHLEESPLFQEIKHKTEEFPIKGVFQKTPLNMIAAWFIVGLGGSVLSLLFLFTPAYITDILHRDLQGVGWISSVAVFVSSILCILFGFLSDFLNHRLLLFILSTLSIALIYPIFLIYIEHFSYLWIAVLMSAFLNGFAWGVLPSFLTELFPTSIRYSGVAITYNLGLAVFGGLTPFIAAVLIQRTGLVIAPIFYFLFIAGLALISLAFVRKAPKLPM